MRVPEAIHETYRELKNAIIHSPDDADVRLVREDDQTRRLLVRCRASIGWLMEHLEAVTLASDAEIGPESEYVGDRDIVRLDEGLCHEAMRGLYEVSSGVGLGRTTSADIQRYVNCIRDHIEPEMFKFVAVESR